MLARVVSEEPTHSDTPPAHTRRACLHQQQILLCQRPGSLLNSQSAHEQHATHNPHGFEHPHFGGISKLDFAANQFAACNLSPMVPDRLPVLYLPHLTPAAPQSNPLRRSQVSLCGAVNVGSKHNYAATTTCCDVRNACCHHLEHIIPPTIR